MNRRQLQITVEYLRVLDLDAGAGIAEVREAYRLLLRTWDPNRSGYDPKVRAASERKVAEVRQAFEWLRDNGDLVLSGEIVEEVAADGVEPQEARYGCVPGGFVARGELGPEVG